MSEEYDAHWVHLCGAISAAIDSGELETTGIGVFWDHREIRIRHYPSGHARWNYPTIIRPEDIQSMTKEEAVVYAETRLAIDGILYSADKLRKYAPNV